MTRYPLLLSDLRGGRNGVDSPLDPKFPINQCVEAQNTDWTEGALGRKRGGCDNLSITGGTAFSTGVRWMFRHVPGGDETLAELWAMDGAGLLKRLVAGTAWANVTMADALTGNAYEIAGATFNGKLWILYKSAVNRSHLYDPLTANVRRVGVNPLAVAPTMANTGAGAWAAVKRYYRVRFAQLNGTQVIRKSDPTPSGNFTPSGAGLATRVTRPAAPGEGETHWYLEASSDDINYVQSGSVIIGTTFIDDNYALTNTAIWIGSTSEATGLYALFPSMKFAISDANRIIGAGSWDAAETHQSRIWLSPVLGSSDRGDDERWINTATQKGILDINENDGGQVVGLGGPINGVFWAFKYRQITQCTPTSDPVTPYTARKRSYTIGAINHPSIVLTEDAAGNPTISFLSYKGPYRIAASGQIQYMGRDIEDVWKGKNGYSAVNLSATVVGHGLYYAPLSQLWFWVSTGANNIPDTLLVQDIRRATGLDQYGVRGGWSVFTGDAAAAYCSAMFANTVAAAMSKDLKPYIGRSNTTIYKCDSDTANSDNGVAFKAFVKTRTLALPSATGGVDTLHDIGETYLVAKAQPGVGIRQTIVGDFDKNFQVSDTQLDPKIQETRVIKKFEGSMQSDLGAIQIQLGDAQAVSSRWSLDSLSVPVSDEGGR